MGFVWTWNKIIFQTNINIFQKIHTIYFYILFYCCCRSIKGNWFSHYGIKRIQFLLQIYSNCTVSAINSNEIPAMYLKYHCQNKSFKMWLNYGHFLVNRNKLLQKSLLFFLTTTSHVFNFQEKQRKKVPLFFLIWPLFRCHLGKNLSFSKNWWHPKRFLKSYDLYWHLIFDIL